VRKLSYFIFLFFGMAISCPGQNMPIDFNEVTDQFTAFGGSGFSISTDPENASNAVGQLTNNGNDIWEGAFIDLATAVNLDANKILSLSFYQSNAENRGVLLKLEGGSGPDVEVLRNVSAQGWTENLIFDFSNATVSGSSDVVMATGSYSRLTIFIDGGSLTAGTFFLDNIKDGSEASDPNELDVIYEELVWADEFDGPGGPINTNNWFHQTLLPDGNSWYNNEVQHYTDRIENSYVENGLLHIVAIKEPFTDQGVTKEYTSARLNSKFAFTYGRVDVRAQLPSGDGTWPAIWTLGKNINEPGAYWQTQGFGEVSWPACGELDMMEHGLYATNEVSVAVHTPSSFGNTVNTASQSLPDVAGNFYVYSMNWSPNEVAFMIDGTVIYRYNPNDKNDNTWPFYQDQYMILNIAMGGAAGGIDPNFTQSSMIIDYVRVYQSAALSLETATLEDLKIYPNPARDVLMINGTSPVDRAEVYSILGQLISIHTPQDRSINTSQLPAGVYVLNLYAGGLKKSLKFVKN
jgi:beta-glucanase (GH16 family)